LQAILCVAPGIVVRLFIYKYRGLMFFYAVYMSAV
jgi:hypothetical protein